MVYADMPLEDTADKSYEGLAQSVKTKEASREAVLNEARQPAQQEPPVASEEEPEQRCQKKDEVGPYTSHRKVLKQGRLEQEREQKKIEEKYSVHSYRLTMTKTSSRRIRSALGLTKASW